ncbi:hypothetical protein [Riemerella anatipestifer]|uniref:hypothetical protein n=1 Tax=Riemerella anatipestifer TaxID=34085 RepID=UPI0021D593C2|nr:hypothetical protein [Riemerella anatipestifer]MCU7541912.1 hypothetical protein [Riemerella anatipestifer]MCW0512499.1 hypothetical protein [Riemerella anatipestifer]MDY3350912.1 hypothetical protein [Riemerella anatipestifer]
MEDTKGLGYTSADNKPLFKLMETVCITRKSRNPFINFECFASALQVNTKKLHSILKDRQIPDEVIVGGYEALNPKKRPLFYRDKALEYIKQLG